MPVPVEGEHGVDQVLDRTWPGQVAVLGHVPDQEKGDPAGLGHASQALDAGAHLGQAAGRLGERRVRDGLERVHHDQGGPVPGHRLLDRPDVMALQSQELWRDGAQS